MKFIALVLMISLLAACAAVPPQVEEITDEPQAGDPVPPPPPEAVAVPEPQVEAATEASAPPECEEGFVPSEGGCILAPSN
jgi:hypothetical protein